MSGPDEREAYIARHKAVTGVLLTLYVVAFWAALCLLVAWAARGCS